jgi:hypothetical protein
MDEDGQAPEIDPDVVEEFFRMLEARGVPEGTWLLDIEQVRGSLQQADDLLRRLKDAVIRSASSTPLG